MNTFTFSGKLKRNLLLVMLAGALFILVGALTFGSGGDHGDGHGDGHGDAHALQEHVDHSAQDLHLEEADDAVEAVAEHTGEVDNGLEVDGQGADAHAEETHADAHGEVIHAEEAHADDHAAAGHGEDAHGEANAEHPATLKHVIISNSWVMIMYLFWIAVAAMFFLAAHTVGWAGWHIMIQKVTLAIMTLIPVIAVLGIIVFILGKHELYEWTHSYFYDPEDARFDALLNSKRMFLNVKTYAILGLLWVAILTWLLVGWWKKLHNQDVDPDLKHFRTARTIGAASIVIIAVINAFGVWHWIMSIEPHWYSTLFAWYTMASATTGMFAFTILIVMMLKAQGYLKNVNDNHYHDLAKYMFAISVFWTYLWFSQYMLIWYGNIPEETTYFMDRMSNYPGLFYGSFIINFLLPFFVLMKRDTKRNMGVLIFMCGMLILGHWFDFFNSIVTPVVKDGGMGLISIGCLLLFTGFAGFVVFSALSRMKDLDSSQHPYYKESLDLHI